MNRYSSSGKGLDFKTIISEYGSKRGTFHPNKPSPNIFMNKLEYRMKTYYSHLLSSSKCLKK